MASVEVTRIDRQAWLWHKKLIEQWRGRSLRLHPHREELTIALLRWNGLDAPLPHDRLDLVRLATRRFPSPSREAFVTLALVDYIEDMETLPIGERSARLPYQLAWARAGFTLSERTGLPGGIVRARWPDVAIGAIDGTQGQPGLQRHVEPGGLRPVRLEGSADAPGGPEPQAPELRRAAPAREEAYEQLRIDGVSGVPNALDN